MKKLLQTFPAFTLIELLVVISIIGILAALLMANFAGIRDRADDARLKSDLKQLQTALRLQYNDTQAYPDTPADGGACGDLVLTGYVDTIPDPCTYARGTTADTFKACVPLTNAADSEAAASVTKCDSAAVGSGYTTPYCVCSN